MKQPAYPQSFRDPLLVSDFHLKIHDDPANTLCLDFETFYDPDTYSVSTMGAVAYANDPRADFYLLSAAGHLGGERVEWAGHPLDFPYWERIAEGDVRLIAANAEFEETITWALLHHLLGWPVEKLRRVEYLCVLDLARFNTLTGNLAAAVADAGLADSLPKIDKSIRDELKGKTFRRGEPVPEKYIAYVIGDALAGEGLWIKYGAKWPDFERWFSVANRRRNTRGVPIDADRLDKAIQHLGAKIFEFENTIPWTWRDTHKTPTADRAFREECRKHGIAPPKSLAQTDPEYMAWEAEHAPAFPWIVARRDWKKANLKRLKLQGMRARLTPGNQMPFEQRYFGAHTGRAAGGAGRGNVEGGGGSGINMQNMARNDFYGVNERNMITAPDGHILLVKDYSQIEPRLLYWRAGMKRVLDLVKSGIHLYEAHARLTMGYDSPIPLKKQTGEEFAKLYQVAKARVIGLGYGCGALKFQVLAETYRLKLTFEESDEIVRSFRATNPEIVTYWNEHDKWLRVSCCAKDPRHTIELVSGRLLRYYQPEWSAKPNGKWGTSIRPTPRESPKFTWGGSLTENEIQATAGDVLRTGLWNLRDSHLDKWLLDVHDEVVFCVPKEGMEEINAEIGHAMTHIPWLPAEFPLEMSTETMSYYQKTP